jgi:cytoskeleton protein RodZ
VEPIVSNQTDNLLRISEMHEENGRDEADYLSFMPGQRLRKARELRGMTIEQVAQELNLPARYIQAMETDSYKDLPEPAFVRGYMRRYAQLVKLSPDDIAAKFDQCYAEDKATPAPDIRPHNPIQVLGVIARRPKLRVKRLLSWGAVIFLLVLAGGFLWNGLTSRSAIPVADAPTEVPVEPAPPVPVTPGATPAVPPADSAAPAPTLPTPVPGPGMNVLPTPSGPAVLPTPAPTAPAPVAPPSGAVSPAAPDTLVLNLSAESWVSVSDGRRRQLASVLSKPQTLTLRGEAPFTVNVGNAPAVTMSVNGRAVDLRPHTRGAVATLTVSR